MLTGLRAPGEVTKVMAAAIVAGERERERERDLFLERENQLLLLHGTGTRAGHGGIDGLTGLSMRRQDAHAPGAAAGASADTGVFERAMAALKVDSSSAWPRVCSCVLVVLLLFLLLPPPPSSPSSTSSLCCMIAALCSSRTAGN